MGRNSDNTAEEPHYCNWSSFPSLALNHEKNGRTLRGCMGSADWTASSHATVEGGVGPETTSLWVLRSGNVRGILLWSRRWGERKSGRVPEPYECEHRSTCRGCTHQAEYRRETTLWRDWWPWAVTSLTGRCMCAGGDGKTCEVKGTNPKEPRAPEAIMSLSGNSCELAAQHLTVSDLPACSTTGGGPSSRKPVRPWGRGGKSWALTLPSCQNECVHLGLNYGVEQPLRIFKGHWLCVCHDFWCQSAGGLLHRLPVCLLGLCCFLLVRKAGFLKHMFSNRPSNSNTHMHVYCLNGDKLINL